MNNFLCECVVWTCGFTFKVTGYSLGRVLRPKRINSQCSLAPDYGYKRWSTDRKAPSVYTQPEGIGYLVGAVCRGWSNFVNPKSDQPSNQERQAIVQIDSFNLLEGQTECFFGSVVRFLRNNLLSSKTVHTSRLFASVKLQPPTILFLMAPSVPALSIVQYVGN